MTRAEAKAFHDELNRTLESLCKKYHLITKKSHVTFNEREVSASLKFEQTEEDGTHKADPITEELLKLTFSDLGYSNLPKVMVGAKFRAFDGKIYTITGYNGKAPKYPIEIEAEDGRHYRSTGKGYTFLGEVVPVIDRMNGWKIN